jgi:hypothetical protein
MVIGFVFMYYLRSKKEPTFDTSKAIEEHTVLVDDEQIQSGIN